MKLSFTQFPRALLRRLREKRFAYTHLIEVQIYRQEVLHNYSIFQLKLPTLQVAPVLKSNAYGHGLVEVARILDTQGIPFLCVDSFFEALILRNEGIVSPILIIGYTPLHNLLKRDLPGVSFSLISLQELQRAIKTINALTLLHLKIDTGMHRQGIMESEIEEAITLLKSNKHVVLEGIFSHLAEINTPHTSTQIALWNKIAKRIHEAFPSLRYIHCSATAGIVHAKEIYANTMRLGIGLYGINPGLLDLDLHPALEMRSRISSLRTVEVGESVGYGGTFTAENDMRIATVPAGYSEGIDRRLSNTGSLVIRDTLCPIVGAVSMNITSLDVSSIPEVSLEDEVLIISKDPTAPNSIERMAELCHTIPYDLLVHIPEHLHRRVI